MKTPKTFFKLLFIIIVMTQTAQAQETAKGIKDQGVKSHTHQNGCCQYKVISIGGGFNNPSSGGNQQVAMANTAGLTLDYQQTIVRKPGFSIGINIGGQYFSGSSTPSAATLPQPYLIANQISSAVTGSGNNKSSGYFIGIGPQFNIHFANHFVFSPIFQVGFLGVTQSEFKATQTTLISGGAVPNYTKTYDLMTQTETKTSGLGFIPKARLTYMISKTIGVWAEANYTMGSTAKNSISIFAPQGEPSSQGVYSVAQMDAGTYKTVVGDTKYNAVGFSFGVVFSFGNQERGASAGGSRGDL
ncbi:MAG: hypothetical protein K2X95_00125 [Flavobacteriaceae bacterium]|nr:hypothetical protein [Flavobacteriaceae bacterium]